MALACQGVPAAQVTERATFVSCGHQKMMLQPCCRACESMPCVAEGHHISMHSRGEVPPSSCIMQHGARRAAHSLAAHDLRMLLAWPCLQEVPSSGRLHGSGGAGPGRVYRGPALRRLPEPGRQRAAAQRGGQVRLLWAARGCWGGSQGMRSHDHIMHLMWFPPHIWVPGCVSSKCYGIG